VPLIVMDGSFPLICSHAGHQYLYMVLGEMRIRLGELSRRSHFLDLVAFDDNATVFDWVTLAGDQEVGLNAERVFLEFLFV